MTPERMRRHDDERLYQPRIHSQRIRKLYRISKEIEESITVLVDQALRWLLERQSSEGRQEHGHGDDEEQDGSSDTLKDQSGF